VPLNYFSKAPTLSWLLPAPPPPPARLPPKARLPSSPVAVDEVLAAVGAKHAEAVIFAALPGAAYASVEPALGAVLLNLRCALCAAAGPDQRYRIQPCSLQRSSLTPPAVLHFETGSWT
jgi:hypothetical protein